ncbi:hypothetical protein GYMLUDRAFT_245300 [Collybiopsis luxurians FD-317 M1]|uniref:Uncharacterized protein n=1 Tax=Collybiopsis luxurians FD-317 M1 TaxID=944289 RepID=A0A0D0B6Y1_9AGAR|nr:hypothetical protein GYMLUDRAFT_245300 [Collybiopsis luxurians FD-317 M1]
MEAMVDQFQDELLPVVAQLTSRLSLRPALSVLLSPTSPSPRPSVIPLSSMYFDVYYFVSVPPPCLTPPKIQILRLTIKQHANYKQMLLHTYVTAITNDQLGENDRINGCKHAGSVLWNFVSNHTALPFSPFCPSFSGLAYPGLRTLRHPEQSIQQIITTTWDGIDAVVLSQLKLPLLEAIINCVLYNPSASLTIVGTTCPGSACTFFEKVHDKKLSIVMLASLMELEHAQIPESVREGWGGVGLGLPKAIADRKALEEALAEEEDKDDFDNEKVLNMNGDDVLSIRNPSGYQVATTSLTVEEQTFLMDVMRVAEQPPAATVGD